MIGYTRKMVEEVIEANDREITDHFQCASKEQILDYSMDLLEQLSKRQAELWECRPHLTEEKRAELIKQWEEIPEESIQKRVLGVFAPGEREGGTIGVIKDLSKEGED